jgi:hypothetical protein
MLNGIVKIFDIDFIISRVFSLSFINADHHQDFIMLFAGHPVFSSIPAILFQYKSCIFDAVSINFSLFHPKICSIIGNSKFEFIMFFTVFSGHAKNQSDVINSDHSRKFLFSSLLYFLNIFFVITLHGRSVIQSIGASHKIILFFQNVKCC